MLGAWLMLGPAALNEYARALIFSNFLAGVLLVGLGCRFAPRRGWTPWAAALVGLWLLLAPVVFWASSPVAYASNTLIGSLVIALSVVMPYSVATPGPAMPRGWSYNPSSWAQRTLVIALAVIGSASASYIAAYERGFIRNFWDPFFYDAMRRFLESDAARPSPVPIGGLAAASLLVTALVGATGDCRRWRTMPFVVVLFGVVVFFLACASVLAIVRTIGGGLWCTACLLSNGAVFAVGLLTIDELVATVQFVVESQRGGASAWDVFWHGEDALYT
jgi:peptidoglycan/LPS O-acetylase OafA/YrhL